MPGPNPACKSGHRVRGGTEARHGHPNTPEHPDRTGTGTQCIQMSRGLYGARDLHKHGWKLPIPRYRAANPLHARLAALGAEAEAECRQMIREHDLLSQPAGAAQSRKARNLLRHSWQLHSDVARDIEQSVADLLSDPAQIRLAAQQMEEAEVQRRRVAAT